MSTELTSAKDDVILNNRLSTTRLARTSMRLDWLDAVYKQYGKAGLPASREGSTFLKKHFDGHMSPSDVIFLFDLVKCTDAVKIVLSRFTTFPIFVDIPATSLESMTEAQLKASRDKFESAQAGFAFANVSETTCNVARAYRQLAIALSFEHERTRIPEGKTSNVFSAARQSMHFALALSYAMNANTFGINGTQIADMLDTALPLCL